MSWVIKRRSDSRYVSASGLFGLAGSNDYTRDLLQAAKFSTPATAKRNARNNGIDLTRHRIINERQTNPMAKARRRRTSRRKTTRRSSRTGLAAVRKITAKIRKLKAQRKAAHKKHARRRR